MNTRKPVVGWVLVLGLATSCRFVSQVPPQEIPSPIPVPATITPTPFLPVPPTVTPVPTETPIPTDTPTPTVTSTPVEPWENFPAPSSASATEIPRVIRDEIGDEHDVNIILIGTDDASGRRSLNSDVMILISIDTDKGTVSAVSFPRDLYVYLPGKYMARINTAYAYGGSDLLALTMRYNFGIRVDAYARVNFVSFEKVVDTLGGIDVVVGQGFTDFCGRSYSYRTGQTYHMDGVTALCYVRMRKASGGDLSRNVRAQEVLLAMFRKIVSLEGLTNAPELYRQYSQTVENDIGLEDILTLMPTAAKVAQDDSRIRRYTLAGLVSSWRTPGGGAVLLPNKEAVQTLLEEALN